MRLGTFDTINLCTLLHSLLHTLARTTDIERSQNSHTAPCNGIVSHGAPIWGIRAFADHTRGNKHKENVPTIFTRFAHVYFHTQTGIHMQLMNHGYFDHGKNPNTLNWIPFQDKDGTGMYYVFYVVVFKHRQFSNFNSFCLLCSIKKKEQLKTKTKNRTKIKNKTKKQNCSSQAPRYRYR